VLFYFAKRAEGLQSGRNGLQPGIASAFSRTDGLLARICARRQNSELTDTLENTPHPEAAEARWGESPRKHDHHLIGTITFISTARFDPECTRELV